MSHNRIVIDDAMVAKCRNASSLGMPLTSIAALCGMSPNRFYHYLRLGEVSSALEDSGLDDPEIASEIGVDESIAIRTRSLYQSIALGRALGEESALQALAMLTMGIGDSETVPTVLPSLPAIKLRLGMSVHYNDTQSNTPQIDQTSSMRLDDTNRLSLSDLQAKRDHAVEQTRLLTDGQYEIRSD